MKTEEIEKAAEDCAINLDASTLTIKLQEKILEKEF